MGETSKDNLVFCINDSYYSENELESLLNAFRRLDVFSYNRSQFPQAGVTYKGDEVAEATSDSKVSPTSGSKLSPDLVEAKEFVPQEVVSLSKEKTSSQTNLTDLEKMSSKELMEVEESLKNDRLVLTKSLQRLEESLKNIEDIRMTRMKEEEEEEEKRKMTDLFNTF